MKFVLPSNPRIIATLFFVAALIAAPIAFADEPAAPAPAPSNADEAITHLLQVDPAQLAAWIKDAKAKADALASESASLKGQAAELEKQIAELEQRLKPFLETLTALAKATGMAAAPEPQAMAPAGEMAPGPQAMAPEGEMKEAAAIDAPNFADHVLPILQARCLECHNVDKQKGGLNLETFDDAIFGGSSGEVVKAGNPGGSRMIELLTRTEDPMMPPSGDRLKPEQIETIRQWIAGGLLAKGGAKSMIAKSDQPATAQMVVAAARSDGPPPMPEVQLAALSQKTTHSLVARAIAASPSAPLLAVGGYKEVLLYNLEDFKLLGALPFPEGEIFTMTFSVNGEVLVAGGGEEGHSGEVILWNVRTGQRLGAYGKGYDTVLAADVSPDHSLIAVGGPNRVVRVYAAQDGKELYKIDSHTDWIYAVKFSPDGELLATADRAGNLALWQATTGRHATDLKGHNGAINALAYTADSAVLASAGNDGQVFMWDTWNNNAIRNFGAHSGPVLSLQFAPNNQLVTAGVDGLTKRWDLNGTALTTYAQLPDWAYQTAFGKQGALVVSGSWNGQINVWNAENGEQLAGLTTNPDSQLMVAAAK